MKLEKQFSIQTSGPGLLALVRTSIPRFNNFNQPTSRNHALPRNTHLSLLRSGPPSPLPPTPSPFPLPLPLPHSYYNYQQLLLRPPLRSPPLLPRKRRKRKKKNPCDPHLRPLPRRVARARPGGAHGAARARRSRTTRG
ncbi:hypothetical protein VTK26DRAFT_3883 [Humicola hyalothermophila]